MSLTTTPSTHIRIFLNKNFFPGYDLPSIVEIQLSGYKNISLPAVAFL